MKSCAILQSNYIPWRGYFDIINSVDLFIFHDDLQYTKRDWRNRNIIKTHNGKKWLSIPVGRNESRNICEVEMKDQSWKKTHKQIIHQHYRKAKYYEDFEFIMDKIYDNNLSNLSEFNINSIKVISECLGLKTEFSNSALHPSDLRKTDKLIYLIQKFGIDKYISGPAGKNYINEYKFKQEGIKLEYFDYTKYGTYNQLNPPFLNEVTILDLIFNEGRNSVAHLLSWRS